MKKFALVAVIFGLLGGAAFADSPEQSKNDSGAAFSESNAYKSTGVAPVVVVTSQAKSAKAVVNSEAKTESPEGSLAVPSAASPAPAAEAPGWKTARRVAETGGAVLGAAVGWAGYLAANFETGGSALAGFAVIGACGAAGFAAGRYGTDLAERLFASK